ncbi:hypothetical protein [Rothia uropygialis]|uniref:hypothetical protein n=1 Tax=Kocuria sp. 36 TaxID=1415402 RepID=UPI00101DB526|nr:hypothetical protein [Kocuria sp. 36]
MFVLTVDQVGSRKRPDAVPQLVSVSGEAVLPFDRTAGDEAQAVFDNAGAAIDCALSLASGGEWHCGLGQGRIEEPLPRSAREGRGTAYINARHAVDEAKKSGAHHFGFSSDSPLGAGIQAGLRTVIAVWGKRRDTTREAYEWALTGKTQAEIAAQLKISQQAVSGRLAAGMYRELEDLKREMTRWAEYLDAPGRPGEKEWAS